MNFSRHEVQELGLGQLSSEELDEALEAFNGFVTLFGRTWLESFFHGVQSAWFVRWIIFLWKDWQAIRHLAKSEQLIERWSPGVKEGGVITEVRVLSHLVRAGADVELFPEASNRVPDCRFRRGLSNPWIYIETSARGLSKALNHGQRLLQRVATAAAEPAPGGMHGKVAILRTPSPEEANRIVAWLRQCRKSGDLLEDLAEFYIDTNESGTGANDILEQRVPKPALSIVYIAQADSVKKGTARLAITDAGAENALRTEAAQLPEDEIGVVVLDVTHVVGGDQLWGPLILRRFQPSLHTRVSAVILVNTSLTKDGPAITGQVLLNPYAKRPAPPDVLAVLEGLIRGSGEMR